MKFEPGDRVAVYGPEGRSVGLIERVSDGIVVITCPGGSVMAHPKACRKLVKSERRRVWILEADLNDPARSPKALRQSPLSNTREWKPNDYIEFIEVRRPKK